MESHTKFDDLQSEWTEKKRLRELVKVQSKKRTDSLIKSKVDGSKTTMPFNLSKVIFD